MTKFDNIDSAPAVMSQVGMLLLVLDEVTDPSADLFDREATFVEKVIKPIVAELPQLKVGREHITSKEATKFLPVLKHKTHHQTLLQAVASGRKKFYSERTAHPCRDCCRRSVVGGILCYGCLFTCGRTSAFLSFFISNTDFKIRYLITVVGRFMQTWSGLRGEALLLDSTYPFFFLHVVVTQLKTDTCSPTRSVSAQLTVLGGGTLFHRGTVQMGTTCATYSFFVWGESY